LQGTGNFILGQASDIRNNVFSTVAANVTGNVSVTSVNSGIGAFLSVGTVGGVSGIQSHGGNIVVYSDSTAGLQINAAVTTGSATTGTVDLIASEATTTGNQPLALNAAVTGGTVRLTAADNVTQTSSGVISASSLVVRYADGSNADSVDLSQADNQVQQLAASVSGTAVAAGNSFSFRNAAATPLQVTTVDGVAGINSAGGDINLRADSLDLAQTVNASALANAKVTITTTSAARAINLGTESASALSLTAAELALVKTGNNGLLRIGDLSNTGGISLTSTLAAPAGTWTTLSLKSGGTVNQTGGALSVANLAVEAQGAGAVSITNAGTSSGAVAISANGNVSYTYGGGGSADLTVTSIDGVSGVSSQGGNIALSSAQRLTLLQSVNAGSGTLALAASGGGITQTGGTLTASGVKLTGSGAFTLDQAGNQVNTLAAAITGSLSLTSTGLLQVGSVGGTNGITSNGGAVTLTADRMAINQSIVTNNGGITLKPLSVGTGIDLGSTSDSTANTLELSASEISRLTAGSGTVSFGDAAINGQINLSVALSLNSPVSLNNGSGGILFGNTLSSTGSVTVNSGGTVADAGGTSGISATSLNVTGNGGLSFTGSGNTVATLYLNNNGGGNIQFVDHATGLSINSVAQAGGGNIAITNTGTLSLSASPISTGGGDLTLASGGAMILLQDISAGTGTVNLQVGSGGLTQGSGIITANALRLSGAGNFLLNSFKSTTAAGTTTYSYNNVATLAADISGSLTYRDEDALSVGTVGVLTGINTHGNNLTLTSGGLKTQAGATVTTVGGTLSLDSSLQGGVISLTANNAAIQQNTGTITASTLVAVSNGSLSLNQAGNHADNISLTAGGQVDYKDAGAFSVTGAGVSSGSSNAAVNLTSTGLMTLTQSVNAGTGRVTLTSGGGITQSGGGITGGSLLVQGVGDFLFANGATSVSNPGASNNVNTLAANVTGNFTYINSGALTVDTVGAVSGVTSSNGQAISLRTVNGDLTVNQAVVSGSPGARGNVSVMAGGGNSVLTLNHDVRGADVRINSEGTLVQNSPGCGSPPCSGVSSYVEAVTLSLGAQNDPVAAVANHNADVSMGDLTRYFKGTTVLNEDLVAGKLIIYGLDGATSFQLGSGHYISATTLMLGGSGSFYLNNTGNNINSLVVFRPWGSNSSYKVSYTDVDSFAIGSGSWDALLTTTGWTWTGNKTFTGVNNNGLWPSLGFGGNGGDVTLVANGAGNSIILSNSILTGGMVSLTSPAGLSEAAGALIKAGSLKVIANGPVLLGNDNDISTFAAQVSQANALTLKTVGNVAVGTVDGLSGVSLTGPGEATLDIYSGGNLAVNSDVSVVTASGVSNNTAPAHLKLRANGHVDIAANVTARGGSAVSGVGSEILLQSTHGHVSQTSGTISAYDDGPANLGSPTPAPHSAQVTVRAGADALDNGYNIANCSNAWSGCGAVTLGNVYVQSTLGGAYIDVYGPLGLTVNGNLTAKGQTAPRISLTSDIQDSSQNLVSSRDVVINGNVTVDQPGGVDVNTKPSNSTAGLLVSGNNITTSGTLSTTSKYGVSISAQNNITIGGNLSTTANDGVSLSTVTGSGTVKTVNGARVTAKQLGLTGDRDVGIFNLATDIDSLQVLGARALTIDNSVHTGMLLATVIGRVSAATTDPNSGQVIPAVDKPVGSVSITTGGGLTTFSLNNNSSKIWDLNGNIASKRSLVLVTDNIVETPGAFSLSADTVITLRPYTPTRPIVVKNIPSGTADPGTTYYYGGVSGLLNQFNPNATLIIGGPGYLGNITVGSQSGGNWASSEQFSLGNMSVTFSTAGRVYNLFSIDPDTPSNWSGAASPYTPNPPITCAYGQACIAKISSNEVIIIDSLKLNGVKRNVRIAGQGNGSGGYTPPTSNVSGGDGNSGGGNGGGSNGSNSSGSSGGTSSDAPGGGGTQGTPGGTVTTVVVVTTPPTNGGAGTVTETSGNTDGTSNTTPAPPVDLAPDGGSGGHGGTFSGVDHSSNSGGGEFSNTPGNSGGDGSDSHGFTNGNGSFGGNFSGDGNGNGSSDQSGFISSPNSGNGGDNSGFNGATTNGGNQGSLLGGGDGGSKGADGSGFGGNEGGVNTGTGTDFGTGGTETNTGNGLGNGAAGDGGTSGSGGFSGGGSAMGGSGGESSGFGSGTSATSGSLDGQGLGSDGAAGTGGSAAIGGGGSGLSGNDGGNGTGSTGGTEGSTGTGAGGGNGGLAGAGSSSGADGSGLSGNTGTGGEGMAAGGNGGGVGSGADAANGGSDGKSDGLSGSGSGSSGAGGSGFGNSSSEGGSQSNGVTDNGSGTTDNGTGGQGGALSSKGEGGVNGNGGGNNGQSENGSGSDGTIASGHNGQSERDEAGSGQGQGSASGFVGGGEGDAAAAGQQRQAGGTGGANGNAGGSANAPRNDTPECAADRSQEVRTVSSSPDGGRPLVTIKGPGARLSGSSCGTGAGGGNR
jgi:hypothetical protein